MPLRQLPLALALAAATIAAPEDYHATSRYGKSSSTLASMLFEPEIAGATLLSETTEPDGRKRLSFHFNMRNASGGYFESPGVFLNQGGDLPWGVEMVTPAAEAPELPPGTSLVPANATTTAPLTFLIAAGEAEAAKSAILNREHLHITAYDLYRFSAPIRSADAAMDAAFADATSTGNQITLRFSASTPSLATLAAGTLLVHNPRVFELRLPAFTGELVLRHYLTNVETADETAKQSAVQTKLFQISSIATNPTDGTVAVTGFEVPAVDLMVSAYTKSTQLDGFIGTIPRDPYNPPTGTSFHTASEYLKRASSLAGAESANQSPFYPPGVAAEISGLFNLHYPMNDVEIAPGVTIDGEVLFNGLDVSIEALERDNQKNKWAFRLTNRFGVTLRLTAEAGVQLADLEKTVVSVPLPTVVIPVFQTPITIQPLLKVKVGAAVSAGSRIQVPVQCAIDAGFEMAYDGTKPPGSGFSFRPFAEPVPMRMSKPSLARAVEMNAKAWAELGLDLLLQNTIGPGIAVRATGDLDVHPFADPWWELNGDVELRGRFALNLFGIPLLTADAPPHHLANLFHRDAGGPRLPANPAGPLDREEGGHVRWARAARWTNLTPYGGRGCRVSGTPEDVFVVMNSAYPNTTLMRVDANGRLVWTHSINEPLQHVVGTPDGGVILGGCASGAPGIRLLKYSGNGTLVWEKQHLLNHNDTHTPQLYVSRMLARETGGGSQELHLAGWRYRNLNSRHVDPFLIRCDGDGNVSGVRSYDSPDYVTVADATYASDGGLIWCGMCQSSPDGTSYPGPGVSNNGWLMKTDGLGNLQWSTITPSMRGNLFTGVAAAPDGTIFTCGYLMTVVDPGYGSAQLTKHNATGGLLTAVTLSETTDSASVDDYAMKPSTIGMPVNVGTNPTGPAGTGFENWLPDSGKTVWDEGKRIVWTPDGLLVVTTTGLAANRAATVGCLTEDFSVRWFSGHERGSSEEYLFDIVPTEDGILALGSSAQMLDFKTGTSTGNNCAMLLKLPLEGKCDLHPATRGIHRYLQPGIHDHRNNELELGAYQPNIMPSVPATCSALEGATTLGANLYPHQFVAIPMTDWVPLEAGDPNTPMTYPQWADYWSLPADSQSADADGDGRTNGQEWFFGGSPATDEAGPPAMVLDRNGGNLALSITRGRTARTDFPVFQSSTDLGSWTPLAVGAPVSVEIDPFTDRLIFTIPLSTEPTRFYRATHP